MTAGRKTNSQEKSWNTPTKYADLVNLFFDYSIDLDPCSNKDSIIEAKTKIMLPKDGLKTIWDKKNIFINPPYGRDTKRKTTIKNWIKKAYLANLEYVSHILMLIPVATNTSHWKEFIFGKATICFLKDTRLVFRINGNENNKGSPVACAMIYYGYKIEKFKRIFVQHGYVVE